MAQNRTGKLFETQPQESAGHDGHLIRVAFESGVDSLFDYIVPENLWPVQPGQRVEAPFGRSNKKQTGFCVAADIEPADSYGCGTRLKTITAVVDDKHLIDEQLMSLARWISRYYVCPLGQVLAAVVPAAVKKGAGVQKKRFVYLKTETPEKDSEELKAGKQKEILEFLNRVKAFDKSSAVDIESLLDATGCATDSAVKSLAGKKLLKITKKQVLKSLPAVPESFRAGTENITLNADQAKALSHVEKQLQRGRFSVSLLHGVTDSGKTEIYMRAIEKALELGKTAIVLVPEIALTAQTVQRFSSRFEKLAVMHSALTGSQRNAQWQKIKDGQANVVVGARSAIFAPLCDLGLVVVDEEHEPSYKQDTAPRYNGRDVAVKRAQNQNAHCILASATPSLEMLLNCSRKEHFDLVELPRRVMDLPMPKMKLVDLREDYGARNGKQLISQPLTEKLEDVLTRGEQAILLLNRRGYSNLVLCSGCKHSLRCRNCDAVLTYHKRAGRKSRDMVTITGQHKTSGYALCHYCLAKTVVPQNCPLCGKPMIMIGLGSQRLEEELTRRFPSARIRRIDSDVMARGDYYELLSDFSDGKIDILAGTQMLAKGLHFPNVTLVGIISADTCLYVPDFRSNERTFQLISQVAGRTGRSEKKGIVYVQTFLPEQPAIRFAVANQFKKFVAEELKHRKACNLPPYWRMASVMLRDRSFERVEEASQKLRVKMDQLIAEVGLDIDITGPLPPAISRIQTFHRMQIILKAPRAEVLLGLFDRLRNQPQPRPAVQTTVDIDPMNLL